VGDQKHSAEKEEFMITVAVSELTLCMILVSCIMETITGIHDPGAYYLTVGYFYLPRLYGWTALYIA